MSYSSMFEAQRERAEKAEHELADARAEITELRGDLVAVREGIVASIEALREHPETNGWDNDQQWKWGWNACREEAIRRARGEAA